ncbi:hypothetical protein ACMYSQ_012391 [Aspergillus niger]
MKCGASIPALADQLSQIVANPVKVLDLLLADGKYVFGSEAWLLTPQCPTGVHKELKSGSEAGWRRYIEGCVGTEPNEERKAYWQRAAKALKALKAETTGLKAFGVDCVVREPQART